MTGSDLGIVLWKWQRNPKAQAGKLHRQSGIHPLTNMKQVTSVFKTGSSRGGKTRNTTTKDHGSGDCGGTLTNPHRDRGHNVSEEDERGIEAEEQGTIRGYQTVIRINHLKGRGVRQGLRCAPSSRMDYIRWWILSGLIQAHHEYSPLLSANTK